MHNKKLVKFHAHPSRCDAEKYPPFDLILSSKISYDTLAQKVGEHLNAPATHMRFFTVNTATGNPKTPVKRGATQTLQAILNPTGYQQMNTQRADAFYFEVLDIPLSELDTKKAIKVTLLSEGITKEDTYDLLIAKNGNVADLIEILLMKANLEEEGTAGRLRVYEVSQHKIYRELPRDYPVISLNDYTSLYAERVPEEEANADESSFVRVFHFHTEVNRAHGVPFKFLMKEDEPFSETKKRLEKRTGLKGKSFEKIKFAVVKQGHFSRPQYLSDDDELWHVAAGDEDCLGLDHPDRSRTLRNGVGDLFLR